MTITQRKTLPRNPRGRPPKHPKDMRRNRYTVSFTDGEVRTMKGRARGLKLSDYIRTKSLEDGD